ncbi:MAG: hypothetical protein ACPGXZ_00840 [Saprospiraceae bacterium]
MTFQSCSNDWSEQELQTLESIKAELKECGNVSRFEVSRDGALQILHFELVVESGDKPDEIEYFYGMTLDNALSEIAKDLSGYLDEDYQCVNSVFSKYQ